MAILRNIPLFLLLVSSAWGLGVGELIPKKDLIPTAATPRVSQDQATANLLEGIVLVKGGTPLIDVERDHGVHIYLDDLYPDLKRSLTVYMNLPLTNELVDKIRATINNYFLQQKHIYTATLIPIQEVTDGILVLQVLLGKVEEIRYTGQKWFSESALRRSLDVKKGDAINEPQLLNYITWVNRNPFHHMELIFEPGEDQGKTNINFISSERFPARFFVGADNTGFQLNDEIRVYGGFNWGNTFLIGDLLTYQYTASPDFHTFQTHVFNYVSFLSWKHLLNIYGCYGQVFPEIADFNTSGKNIQLSMRYNIPFLPLYGDFRHSFEWGFDWKFLTNNSFFVGDATQAVIVGNGILNLTQFQFAYEFQLSSNNNALTWKSEIYASFWKDLLPHQTEAAYATFRADSHVRYGYLLFALSERYLTEGEWIISAMLREQLATCTLPTSEQYGLGGADTVRGYYEQQFIADNALVTNFEVYTPGMSLFKAARNQLAFLLFADYAYGRNYSFVLPEFQQQHLIGIGPGLRYSIPPYLNIKADYGFQLKGIPQDHRFGRFHLSINLSY